ncbi:carbohydrate kinase family protein [Streptomyces demainii]|uniref:Sugar/nucleoside kinase (Ribokinase family) n=1 Tax=Streptomyces demainii TaxID=588122 RepID=A0ABT9L5U2_9ACTN|nr:carbohydrate kinase family protein [Streptomyces demainii]MDP9614931.1 sugar/nucleoside kinase (ribokinase family) [Streptomyces demainii]
MPPSFDLLVIGDANPDVIIGPLDAPLAFDQREQLIDSGALTLGGSAAITACGAARLGLRVAFAGRVGDDGAGHYMRDRLAAHGVDVSGLRMDQGLPTPLTVIVTRGDDRAILTAPGTLAATSGRDVPERLLTSARHVHSASFFLMPHLAADLPGLFDTARAAGATTSLDTNDDPSGRWDRTALAPVLARTDVLLPNAAEAHRLAGTDGTSVAAAAGLLARQVPLVAVKNGADGALCHDGRTVLTTAGVRVTAQDAVGAGDSFNAGFLAGRLAGRSLADTLDLAAVCGALSTRAAGGTTAQPTWEEALTHLTTNGDSPS